MSDQKVSVGRIVHYVLDEHDVEQINRRRTTRNNIADRLAQEPPLWPAGAQAHIGSPVSVGDVAPMIVVCDWGKSVNGQVFLNGNDVLWATSIPEGTGPRTWCWPPRT